MRVAFKACYREEYHMDVEVTIGLGYEEITGSEMEQIRAFFSWYGDVATWLGEPSTGFYKCTLHQARKVIGMGDREVYQGKIGTIFRRPDNKGTLTFVEFKSHIAALVIKFSS